MIGYDRTDYLVCNSVNFSLYGRSFNREKELNIEDLIKEAPRHFPCGFGYLRKIWNDGSESIVRVRKGVSVVHEFTHLKDDLIITETHKLD